MLRYAKQAALGTYANQPTHAHPFLMTIALASQFHVYLPYLGTCLADRLFSTLVRAFSMIVKSSRTFV